MIQKTTLDQLPSNIKIVESNGFPTQAFVFYLLKMFRKAQLDILNFDALQKEIDDTQTGAGLGTDGEYSPDTTAHYITEALSLFNADQKLDTMLYNTIKRIVNVSSNYFAEVGNYVLLVDASVGTVIVTMPDPVEAIGKTISVCKVDNSANTVTISPNFIELIAGETSQTLLYDGEVLELVSDGTNWYLGG